MCQLYCDKAGKKTVTVCSLLYNNPVLRISVKAATAIALFTLSLISVMSLFKCLDYFPIFPRGKVPVMSFLLAPHCPFYTVSHSLPSLAFHLTDIMVTVHVPNCNQNLAWRSVMDHYGMAHQLKNTALSFSDLEASFCNLNPAISTLLGFVVALWGFLKFCVLFIILHCFHLPLSVEFYLNSPASWES